MLKLTSVKDLQKLIKKTDSLDEKEKQVFLKLIPIMRSEDLDRIFTVLTMEATVNGYLPMIIEGIKTNLVNINDKTVEGYNLLQKKMIKRVESDTHKRELSGVEKLLNEL